MARNKEGLVLLLDVGPSMHEILPEVEKISAMLMQKKLVYNKYDEVGVVVFGTQDTENDLTKEVGGYEHIMVLRRIKVVDGDAVEVLRQLPRGTKDGDYVDAIVVGMDMLIKKYQSTNKQKKRLCLITNGACLIKDPFEGTKDDQMSTIALSMAAQGIKMESIIVRGRLTKDADDQVMGENDRLLNMISDKTAAKVVYVESATSLLGALRTRKISPVTVFRGHLEISPKLRIKVWVYKKTSEEKFPTLQKYSDKAPSTDKFATHEVKVDFEYKSAEDSSKIVPPEQRIKGYRYGPQVVPISDAELEAVKFKPEKGVKLLGFTDSSNILRHYYMKDVNIFVAEPGNTGATLAVSALARAMKETSKVAILRCVWRQGQASVVIGVLTPNISHKDNVPDSFYFNVLPFAEDVREFQFPSFNSYPASWQPNEQQQEAADNFVKLLDLAPSDNEEALIPDFTPNPVLERFFRHLELKSKDQDAAVPPLDGTLEKIIEPDPDLLTENRHVIEAFCKSFEVKENPKLKKSTRRILQEKPSGSDDEEQCYPGAPSGLAIKSAEDEPTVDIVNISDSTPVQDFEAMISRRDSPDWIFKAIAAMTRKIMALIEDSQDGDTYSKTIDCLVALRKGCVLEQEPKKFNDFLRRVHKFCQENQVTGFWELLESKELSLIPKSEAADSEVTDDEARSFLLSDAGRKSSPDPSNSLERKEVKPEMENYR